LVSNNNKINNLNGNKIEPETLEKTYDINKIKKDRNDWNIFTFDFDMDSKFLKELLLGDNDIDKINDNKMDIDSDYEKDKGKQVKKYKKKKIKKNSWI